MTVPCNICKGTKIHYVDVGGFEVPTYCIHCDANGNIEVPDEGTSEDNQNDDAEPTGESSSPFKHC